jgi:large subunit ribosomal protein L18
MDSQRLKKKRALRRQRHVRKKIVGSPERPRLSVFRSSKHIYAQLIDDLSGVTLAAASTAEKAVKAEFAYGGNVKAAAAVGRAIAQAAAAKGITKAAFDRGPYRFHGRIKALALAANAAGLKCSEPKPGKVRELATAGAAAEPAPAPAADKGGGKKKK